MNSKVIKKIFRFFLWFIGILLLLFVSFYFAFRSPAFQTWVTNRVSGYFSGKWNTVVRVQGVDIDFWKKVVLEGVYVEDQHRDTLLYAEKLKLDIGTFDRDSNTIFIRDAILQNATVKLEKYKNDSALNLQFIINEFASKDTAKTKKAKWNIGIENISLNNVRFAYKLEEDTAYVHGINFSDLLANSIHGKIANINFDRDTIRCDIREFSLYEKSGFQLKDLNTEASISPVRLNLQQTKIFTNNSQIIASIDFNYSGYDDFNHFIDSVKIKSQFNSSNIEMADIAYFAHDLIGIKKRVFFNGNVRGKISDLRGKDILLGIGDETSFMGNFSLTGLPDINQTFMSFDAKELRTSKEGIEKIPLPPFNENHSIELPSNISLFGIIKFKGNFSGFYNDFVSYGHFNTALGEISTDISMKSDSVKGIPSYKGKFSCVNFNLGKFFESENYIGKVSMNVNVDGKGLKKEDANLSMEGTASSFEANGYGYKNIAVKGMFARKIFNGELSVNDENLSLGFNGAVDFSKKLTQMNFTSEIKNANLKEINFSKEREAVSANIKLSAQGNTIDDINGKLNLNDVKLLTEKGKFDFRDFVFSISDSSTTKFIKLNSEIADANLHGKIIPHDMVNSFVDFLDDYLPALFVTKEEKTVKKNLHEKKKTFKDDFVFSVNVKNADEITKAFSPNLSIAHNSSLNGSFTADKNIFSLTANIPQVKIGKYKLQQGTINASTKNNSLQINSSLQRLQLDDSVWVDNINLPVSLVKDSLNFNLNWKNNTAEHYQGNIPGYITFLESAAGIGKPKIKMKILPAEITIADSSWKINSGNEIVKDSSFISVKDLEFISGNQKIKAEGSISEIKDDHLNILLSAFSLGNFNPALKGSGFSIYGTVSGNASVSNVYAQPIFGSSIDIHNLKMNNELIGNGNMTSIYDNKKQSVNFTAKFQRDDAGSMNLFGDYFPFRSDSSIDAEADVRDFHLEFFEPFLKDNLKNIKGNATAQLKLNGTPQKILLTGMIKTKVKNVHVNYLGTDYHFEGNIPVQPNSFDISDITFYDVNNNSADVVNGKIYHTNFKNIQLDIDLDTKKFMTLNTTEKDNSSYYGKFFATGIANIFGYLDNINLTASVKTDRAKNILGKNENTQLFIPLSASGEVGETGFITFVSKDTTKKKNEKYKINTSGFTMDLKVECNTNAQEQIIFDEKVGDIIKGSGKGNIEMLVNEFGELKMFGDYTVEEGDYLFTLRNVVNKKFKIENGGTVHWTGDPTNADINMNAIYPLRTSLATLFRTDELALLDPHQQEAFKRRSPVNVEMNLSGKLLAPDIKFDILLPNVDEFTRQRSLEKIKNTENELNQQVFSLLVMNTFIPPKEGSQATGGPSAESITTSEMLSNQLSNWLSQISNQVDIGVHYRPGDLVNKDEVGLALSTQLLNDKLMIDASAANNTSIATQQNPSAVVGDVNIDYKLTDNGKIRARAFGKTNEGDIINVQKGPYTQGVGIYYREEFETIGELYRRFLGKTRKNKLQP